MLSKFLSLFLITTACATPLEHAARTPCNPCAPQGATGTKAPNVGPDLDSLYLNVLASVKDIHFRKRGLAEGMMSHENGFCCRETLECVAVQKLNTPICYDKFTTNFAFPDGSWGSLTTGEFNAQGAQANLLSGDYTKDGQQGNIYAQDPAAKPNTATLSIPPQWTGTGVGSAIPPTEIASVITDAPAHTTAPSTTGTTPAANNNPATETQGVPPAPAQSKGAAGRNSVDSSSSFGLSILPALVYAVCAF